MELIRIINIMKTLVILKKLISLTSKMILELNKKNYQAMTDNK